MTIAPGDGLQFRDNAGAMPTTPALASVRTEPSVVVVGAGIIGLATARALRAGGLQVTVVDKLTYASNRDNLPASHPRLTFVAGDICDPWLMAEVVPGHDAVAHFAAESHVDRSVDDPGRFFETNVIGTQRLLDQCVRSAVARGLLVQQGERGGTRYALSDEIVLRAGASGILARERRRQTLLDEIRRRGEITTPEAAALLGERDQPAVRRLLDDLARAGLVDAVGERRWRRWVAR